MPAHIKTGMLHLRTVNLYDHTVWSESEKALGYWLPVERTADA